MCKGPFTLCTSPHIDGYIQYMQMLYYYVNIYVIIYVIKMSDDEAVDTAVAVANASRISGEIAETSKI